MNDSDPTSEETPVELITNTDPKPGLKSTEFWMVLAANLIVVALYMIGTLDAPWAASLITVLTALYSFLRNQLKAAHVKAAAQTLILLLALALAPFASF